MYRAQLMVILLIVACSPNVVTSSPSPSPAAPSREPASLPEFPWEREIVDGLRREGIDLGLIGGSKFETLLGPRLPARVFIVRAGAGGAGADVLYLDRPMGEIRVCSTQGNDGFWTYTVLVNGQVVSRGGGSQYVLYSMNDRFFAQAIGEGFDAALRKALGTSPVRC